MGWERPYTTPEVIPAPLPIGARVKINTQALVPAADQRYGRVVAYEDDQVKVLVDPHATRPDVGLVWLYPWDIQAKEPPDPKRRRKVKA